MLVLVVISFGTLLTKGYVVDKIADKVIEKLQKDYSPSPYGPGLDPDKIDPHAISKGNQDNWDNVWNDQ